MSVRQPQKAMPKDPSFDIHPVEWNERTIKNFWDFQARHPGSQEHYFTNRWGREIVALLDHSVRLKGAEVLDYGCGPGYLIEHLLSAGAQVTGLEYSTNSVEAVERRYKGHPSWKGCKLASGEGMDASWDQNFDVVCCIETLEHLPDDQLRIVLAQIREYLKPGGVALFTTPHQEDLEANMVCCPECGAMFHRWQHIRRWTAETLKTKLETSGFTPVFIEGISFQPFRPKGRLSLRTVNLRGLRQNLREVWAAALDKLAPRAFPEGRLFREYLRQAYDYNLVALARPASPPNRPPA